MIEIVGQAADLAKESPVLSVSAAAAAYLLQPGAGGRRESLLRIAVGPRGCAGLGYELDWVPCAGGRDIVVEERGVRVLVDAGSAAALRGARLDYREGGSETGLTLLNPNEASRCGCGDSFRIRAAA